MNAEFFSCNRKKIMEKLDAGLLVLFAGEEPNKRGDVFYSFNPNRNFYYITGLDSPKLILLCFNRGGEVQETLFIERYDELDAKWNSAPISECEAKKISGIEDIKYIDEFYGFFTGLLFKNSIKTLCLDLEKQNWNAVRSPAVLFAGEVRKRYPALHILDICNEFSNLRSVKCPCEIEEIKKAIHATNEGFLSVLKASRPGVSERELAAYLELGMKLDGAEALGFAPIIASGKNAAILHYTANKDKINDNDMVLLDIGAQYNYYKGDISRTIPINGRYTKRQKEIYSIVLEGQKRVIEMVRPGICFRELNEALKKYYAKELVKIGLIQNEKEVSKYFYHGVSHHLGLETHDAEGNSKELLEYGMVITVEPGLYIEDEGIGIRIEDDLLVTKDGYENLSGYIIKTIDEIENHMR